MVAARDVVAHIERRLPGITETALFKLAYYCQAWHLAWEGHPLYPERIEAWTMGPVAAQTWRERKGRPHPEIQPLDDRERYIVEAVIAFYGHLPPQKLIDLTHDEGPWAEAREGLPEGASSNEEITSVSMRRFYTRQAMRGAPAPRRPTESVQVDHEKVLQVAAEEVPRWKTTLERLAE
jgi:uncharacterized phage-associated protein